MFGSKYSDHKSPDHYDLRKTLFIMDWFDINSSKVKLDDIKEERLKKLKKLKKKF